MPYQPTEYQDYQRLTELVHELAAEYPHLARLTSIARSPGEREVWLLTLTNPETGPDPEKPGYLIDGCHHAGEVTATAQTLHIAHWLLSQYGKDPPATELLDTRAVYVVPRLTVDATEEFLHGTRWVRSRVALYPEPEELPGLIPQDVDGDGQILEMRVPDENGEWKVSDRDARLLVRRQPGDREGPFFRVYPEGVVRERGRDGLTESYDGRGVRPAPNRYGLDFNRNYPVNWAMEHRQPGAGPVPFSEPELRGYGEFLLAHPNICGWVTYHTTGGVYLRPGAVQRDDKLNPADLARYRAIGDMAARITGYPHRNLFEVYTVNPDRPAIGSTMEFGYDYLGILMFGPELWDVKGRADLPSWGKKTMKDMVNMSDAEREEEGLKLLEWSDREVGGAGFHAWKPFMHPQLGGVEIGGWNVRTFLANPPPGKFLEEELDKNLPFAVEHALASPRLQIGRVELKPLGGGLWEMGVQILNTGFLPTQVTEVAIQQHRVRGVELELDGAEVVSARAGERRNGRWNLGEIPGRGNEGERWAVFVLRGAPGSQVAVTARHDRAGVSRQVIALH